MKHKAIMIQGGFKEENPLLKVNSKGQKDAELGTVDNEIDEGVADLASVSHEGGGD